MKVQFIASVAPIVRDAAAARSFYQDALGLSFEGGEGDYVFTQKLGVRHFGLWPLAEAAAAAELQAKGYQMIHGARTEPWTQVTARLLSPEGLLVAVCYTPWFHAGADDPHHDAAGG